MLIPNLYNCNLILDDDEKVFDRLADLPDRFDILNALESAAKEKKTACVIYCNLKKKDDTWMDIRNNNRVGEVIIALFHPGEDNPLLDHPTKNHLSLITGPNLQQPYQIFYSWFHYFTEIDKHHPGAFLSESVMRKLYGLQKDFVENGVHYYHY